MGNSTSLIEALRLPLQAPILPGQPNSPAECLDENGHFNADLYSELMQREAEAVHYRQMRINAGILEYFANQEDSDDSDAEDEEDLPPPAKQEDKAGERNRILH